MITLRKIFALGCILSFCAATASATRGTGDYSTSLDAQPTQPGTPAGALASSGTQASCGSGVGAKLAGTPVDITKGSTMVENVTDLSIPVKHGLTLDVKRSFSSRYSTQLSKQGRGALGFANDGSIPSNWTLTYESGVALNTHDDGNLVIWQGHTGGDWVHFGFDETVNFGDGNKLRNPYASGWNNSHYVSVYYPIGDPRCNSPYEDKLRQTAEDITLFILHVAEPADAEDRVDPDNIHEVVLRFSDGRQLHYDSTKLLRYIDANWRNNKAYGASGHVDDFLTLAWEWNAYSLGTGNACTTLMEVLAPPSDGRKLIFNHSTYAAGPPVRPYANVTSVSLDTGTTTYDDLVRFDYVPTLYVINGSPQEGRLWRVWNGDDAEFGVQYDYGEVLYMGGTFHHLDSANYEQDLCYVSEVEDDGSLDPADFPVTRLVMNMRFFASYYFNMTQFARDPNTGDWRGRWNAIGTSDPKLYWKDGQVFHSSFLSGWTNTSSRYTPNSSNTYTQYEQGPGDDVDSLDYNSAGNTPPLLKQTFHSGAGGQNRLVDQTKINIEGDWVNQTDIDYDSYANGIQKVTKVTKYSAYEDVSGTWTADADTKQETTLAYSDSDNLEEPSSLVGSDGRKTEYDYNSSGQVATMTEKQMDLSDSSFDTVAVTTYTYHTTGVNSGLVSQVQYDPVVGETKTTTYVYADSDAGYYDGQTISVTSDDHTTTYTFNDFSQELTVETDDGVTTNTYSSTWLPPRLEAVTDTTGVTTTYVYNDKNQIEEIFEADGEAEERSTTYAYDVQGNQTVITAPDSGVTTYTYNVYGNLLSLEDPEGTITEYVYDSFGRVTREIVSDGGSDLYEVQFSFVEESSGCGSCGGGGGNQIAARTIDDGGTSETLYYRYDLMGRKIGEGTDSDADDMVYTYDGTNLVTITHGNGSALWGTNALSYVYDNYNRLAAETYPNGRTIEFSYDSGTPASRLKSIKDPFGYITQYAFATDDKLTTLTHSSLGRAVFTYDADDRLEQIRNGNGAYTDYTYDAYGRLTSFDIRESGDAQMLKHSWGYDDLHRKGDISIDSDLVADIDGEIIDIGYDAMSRLTTETLTDGGGAHWKMNYAHDDIGNRTRRNDFSGAAGDISFTYDTGNREATVTDSIDPLGYDFKGNVTSRMTLDGNRVYHYEWDAWDRLTSGSLVTGGDHSVIYRYDAQGRMLARVKWGENVATVNYWLGLNKIAEETLTSSGDHFIVRPDDEATTVAEDAGWAALGGGGDLVAYDTDAVRGKILHTEGSNWFFTSGATMIGDVYSTPANANDVPLNTENHVVGLWVRNNNTSETVTIAVGARSDIDGEESVQLITDDGSSGGGTIYLGAALNDGEWHYVEVDMVEQWTDAGFSDDFAKVDFIVVYGNELDVDLDDVIIATGKLGKSYQLSKSAQIGGYLGVQSGSDGGESQAAWSKWYHHYSELGTVQATSNYSGTLIAVSEPDFYGNYQHVYGTRPDKIGITSKFYDADTELYHFNARWYDSERGRWMSKDPIGFTDGVNLYGFVTGNPTAKVDPTGEASCYTLIITNTYYNCDASASDPVGCQGICSAGIVKSTTYMSCTPAFPPPPWAKLKNITWNYTRHAMLFRWTITQSGFFMDRPITCKCKCKSRDSMGDLDIYRW